MFFFSVSTKYDPLPPGVGERAVLDSYWLQFQSIAVQSLSSTGSLILGSQNNIDLLCLFYAMKTSILLSIRHKNFTQTQKRPEKTKWQKTSIGNPISDLILFIILLVLWSFRISLYYVLITFPKIVYKHNTTQIYKKWMCQQRDCGTACFRDC